MIIRSATPDDAERLIDIYAPYILNTAITFECEIPTVDDFKSRIEGIISKYPYLVAQDGDRVVGYAYAGVLISRKACDLSVETSIYIDKDHQHMGVGGMLYNALEKELAQRGFTNMYACIAYPEKDDEYLTANSVEFHKHLGFKQCGKFYLCGFKFGHQYSLVWMEKRINNCFNVKI